MLLRNKCGYLISSSTGISRALQHHQHHRKAHTPSLPHTPDRAPSTLEPGAGMAAPIEITPSEEAIQSSVQQSYRTRWSVRRCGAAPATICKTHVARLARSLQLRATGGRVERAQNQRNGFSSAVSLCSSSYALRLSESVIAETSPHSRPPFDAVVAALATSATPGAGGFAFVALFAPGWAS